MASEGQGSRPPRSPSRRRVGDTSGARRTRSGRPPTKPEDRLDRLTKLASLVTILLPLSAVLYGALQLWLTRQQHRDEMALKYLETALSMTTLRADGKLSEADERHLFETMKQLAITDDLRLYAVDGLARLDQQAELRKKLMEAEEKRKTSETALADARQRKEAAEQRSRELEATLAREAAGRSNHPGEGPRYGQLRRQLEEARRQIAELRGEEGKQALALKAAAAGAAEIKGLIQAESNQPAERPATARPSISRAYVRLRPGDPREHGARPEMPDSGDWLTLEGQGFGADPGGAYLCSDASCVPLAVTSWGEGGISAQVKTLPFSRGTAALTVVISSRANGSTLPEPVEIATDTKRY